MTFNGDHSGSFPTGETAQETGLTYVPNAYVIPTSQRPNSSPTAAIVPVIDMAALRSSDRSATIEEIRKACIRLGFFQIINHGISQRVMDEALSEAHEFFNLPVKERMKYKSDDVFKPVRYGTSLKDGVDKTKFWRVFLKHYAHPLEDWIDSWPTNPPTYREKMGKYSTEARKVSIEIMEAIIETMGLSPSHLRRKMANDVQVVTVNCYPPCPQPDVALGLPPHSDYTIVTTVLQSSQGLEVMDMADGSWKVVPNLRGALQVHVGDHLEVLSNGLYKGVVHRATVNSERMRISIASLHSLGMDEMMETAAELVDDEHPRRYRESSFNDFLRFLASNDLAQGNTFIGLLKIAK